MPTVGESLRSKTRVPDPLTPPVPSVPLVPPDPTWSVAPELTVVEPLYVLLPVKINVPHNCVSEPLPEMALATVGLPDRSKTSAALSVTAPEPSAPLVVALPTWSVPLLTVVTPL